MGPVTVPARRFVRFPSPLVAGAPRRRDPGPSGAALRSAVVPGWGQWASGRRRRGALVLALTFLAALLPVLALLALLSPLARLLPQALPGSLGGALTRLGAGLEALASPAAGLLGEADWALLGQTVLGLNVAAALFRAWAALDAAACARAARRGAGPPIAPSGAARRLLPALATAAAVGLVSLPHLAFGAGALLARPWLSEMLAPPPRQVVAALGPAAATTPTPVDPFAALLPELPAPDTSRHLWDGRSPLNVLLLGTDRRPDEAAAGAWGNSDTVLLVSVDPVRLQATMISVPRDMLLNIPGVGQEKINAAYRVGGPALAVRVVSDFLGVPVHRWASVDTSALATMINAAGGVVVDVERPLRDDDYPNDDYSVRRILIPAGLQWLDGERAVWYARSRHQSNDFDRADRQQRLLLSLKARARDPSLLPRVPSLMKTGAEAVHTDLSPREALALASLAVKSDLRGVQGLVLTPPDYGYVIDRPDLYAVVPDRERVRRAVAALLTTDPTTPVAAAGPPAVRSLPVLPVDANGDGIPDTTP